MNSKPKMQMHPATELARQASPSTDSEVVPVTKYRRLTNAQKRSIVIAANACTNPGEIGALIRRRGVYSSSLSTWRRQYEARELDGDIAKKHGPKANEARAELKQLAQVTRERDKLRQQLTNAKLVIEVQKKYGIAAANRSEVREALMLGVQELTPALDSAGACRAMGVWRGAPARHAERTHR